MQTNQNFTMVAGDTKNITVTIADATGAPVDLSGSTAKWVIKQRYGPGKVSKDTQSGITITDAAAGKILVKLDPQDTVNLNGLFIQELEIIDAQGNVSTVLTGNVSINPSYI